MQVNVPQIIVDKPKSPMSNNTSGFIGVDWVKRRQGWRARIKVEKKEISLGIFANQKDAIKARLMAEKKYFGDFAPQRHLFDEYGIT